MTLSELKGKIKKEMRHIEEKYNVDEWVGMDAVMLSKLDSTVVLNIGCYRTFQIVIGLITVSSIDELTNPIVELEDPD